MTEKLKNQITLLKPYKGIFLFVLLLFGTHFLWKLCVDGDLHSQSIAIFGIDMTSQFYRLSQLTTQVIYWFVCLFPSANDFNIDDTWLYFTGSGIKLSIIWGCTGIKQLYIFITIILLYSGPWKKKLWYIPAGCIILQAYNILRVACIAWLTENHPDRFDFLHEGLFKYIYYGLIFMLWVVWEEAFVRRMTEKNETTNATQ